MIDCSNLTDDQLLQLIRSAMVEVSVRGEAVRLAVRSEFVSAKERLEIEEKVKAEYEIQQQKKEREKIAREAENKLLAEEKAKQAKATENTWACKMAVITALRNWGYDAMFDLNVWEGSDRRIYFEGQSWKYTLFVTGNKYNPPNKLEATGYECWFDKDERLPLLKKFLKAVSDGWKPGTKISANDFTEEIQPEPNRLKLYSKILGLEVSDA
jgi:hypothetical protein